MMGFIAGIILFLGFVVLGIAFFLLRALLRKQDNSPVRDEALMVQDMYRTLGRLEKRVEVLELLLAEHSPDHATTEREDDRKNRDDFPERM